MVVGISKDLSNILGATSFAAKVGDKTTKKTGVKEDSKTLGIAEKVLNGIEGACDLLTVTGVQITGGIKGNSFVLEAYVPKQGLSILQNSAVVSGFLGLPSFGSAGKKNDLPDVARDLIKAAQTVGGTGSVSYDDNGGATFKLEVPVTKVKELVANPLVHTLAQELERRQLADIKRVFEGISGSFGVGESQTSSGVGGEIFGRKSSRGEETEKVSYGLSLQRFIAATADEFGVPISRVRSDVDGLVQKYAASGLECQIEEIAELVSVQSGVKPTDPEVLTKIGVAIYKYAESKGKSVDEIANAHNGLVELGTKVAQKVQERLIAQRDAQEYVTKTDLLRNEIAVSVAEKVRSGQELLKAAQEVIEERAKQNQQSALELIHQLGGYEAVFYAIQNQLH